MYIPYYRPWSLYLYVIQPIHTISALIALTYIQMIYPSDEIFRVSKEYFDLWTVVTTPRNVTMSEICLWLFVIPPFWVSRPDNFDSEFIDIKLCWFQNVVNSRFIDFKFTIFQISWFQICLFKVMSIPDFTDFKLCIFKCINVHLYVIQKIKTIWIRV